MTVSPSNAYGRASPPSSRALSAGACTAVTVTVSVFEVTGAAAKVALAEAVLVMLPASRSAWVTA